MLMDESIRKLKQNKSECSSAFSLMNCFPYQHTFDLPFLFFFPVFPFPTQLPETELFITQVPQACCLTNFEGEIRNSDSDFTIQLSNRQEGCPVRIDLSDEPMEKHLILTTETNLLLADQDRENPSLPIIFCGSMQKAGTVMWFCWTLGEVMKY